ncbi:hypothetical protein J6590_012043 [Homalodisca vitripennis]|nr:hypothetical protein J6590_012043 [Homalodisca vitripennis]
MLTSPFVIGFIRAIKEKPRSSQVTSCSKPGQVSLCRHYTPPRIFPDYTLTEPILHRQTRSINQRRNDKYSCCSWASNQANESGNPGPPAIPPGLPYIHLPVVRSAYLGVNGGLSTASLTANGD